MNNFFFCSRTSSVVDKIYFPESKGLSGCWFAGGSYEYMLCTCTNILINPYNGNVTEVRPNDKSLVMVTGLKTRGYPKYRACVS